MKPMKVILPAVTALAFAVPSFAATDGADRIIDAPQTLAAPSSTAGELGVTDTQLSFCTNEVAEIAENKTAEMRRLAETQFMNCLQDANPSLTEEQFESAYS